MDPEQIALLNYLLSQGLLGPQSMQTGGFVMPMDYDDGVPQGGPSTTQNRGMSFMDNYLGLMADPMLGALAGGQAFDAAAFQPTIERDEVDLPGRRMLTDWRSRNPGTVQQIIAEEIASGGDAASAFAIISGIVTGEPTTPEEAAMKETLTASLPQMYIRDDIGNALTPAGPDLDKVWSMAEELDRAVSSDPIVDEYDETGLRGYNVTETPSELAQKFTELGLPTPYEEYDVNTMMGPDWDAKRAVVGDMQQNIYSAADDARRREQTTLNEQQRRAMAETLMDRVRRDGVGSMFGGQTDQAVPVNRAAAPLTAPDYDPLPFAGRILENQIAEDGGYYPSSGPSVEPQLGRLGTPMSEGPRTSLKRKSDRRAAVNRARPAKQGPSPTMEAYRNYVNASQKVYTPDYMNTWIAVNKAKKEGRTPLSDILSARRAQGVAAGLPIGWG